MPAPRLAMSPQEKIVDAKLDAFMSSARAGTAKPAPWVPPDRRAGASDGPVMSFIRG